MESILLVKELMEAWDTERFNLKCRLVIRRLRFIVFRLRLVVLRLRFVVIWLRFVVLWLRFVVLRLRLVVLRLRFIVFRRGLVELWRCWDLWIGLWRRCFFIIIIRRDLAFLDLLRRL